MSDKPLIEDAPSTELAREELRSRRDFLIGLGRWSKIVIGAAVLGGIAGRVSDAEAAAWVNRRGGLGGGAWVNNRYGGGGAWVNKRGGGGAWVNRRF
ncbi:MAG: hypothetical protein WCA32_04535 [Chromatiaceae bacterium]|jgi:hypothetical protein